MSSIPRDALNASASKPGVMLVPSSSLNDCARASHFLRIVNVAGTESVDDVGRQISEHPLGADVEQLDDAAFVGGDDREIGAGQDGVLQRACFQQRFLASLLDDAVRFQPIVTDRYFDLFFEHDKPLAPGDAGVC